MRLVLATANPGKAAEIAALLPAGVTLLPRPDEVPVPVEDAGDIVGNARIKAAAIAAATGLPAVADDTGLEVDALDGAPGVDTADFGGWQRLLDVLGERSDRRARFRTVALVRWPDGGEVLAEGVCEGAIATGPRGAGGFGYDPVFVPDDGDGRTFAEMTSEQKRELSHRGRAFRALADLLPPS